MTFRLITALAAYGAFIGLSFVLIDDQRFRAAVILLFIALAAKTLIAWKARW
jgi:predicted membrane channel-forming protein YqfA (hemolysin III family)